MDSLKLKLGDIDFNLALMRHIITTVILIVYIIIMIVIILLLCLSGPICLAIYLRFDPIVMIDIQFGVLFLILNSICLFLVFLVVIAYTMRLIHYQIEKRLRDDTYIIPGYDNLLTLLKLESRADKVIGSTLVVLDEDEEENNEVKANYFICETFSRIYSRFSLYIFGELLTSKEIKDIKDGWKMKKRRLEGLEKCDPSEERVKDATYYVNKVYLVVRKGVGPVLSLLGSLSDAISIVYWLISIAIYGFLATRNSNKKRQLYHAFFFFLSLSFFYALGVHISVVTTLFMYYDFFLRVYFVHVKHRKDEEFRGISFDDTDIFCVEVVWYEKAFVVGMLMLSMPVLIVVRLLNIDIISHFAKVESYIWLQKTKYAKYINKEGIYDHTMYFWTVGKSLPFMYVQYVSVVISFCFAVYFFFEGENLLYGIAMLLSAFIGVISSHISFFQASFGMMSLNRYLYPQVGFFGYAWCVSFFLLQCSNFMIRLLPLLLAIFNCILLFRIIDTSESAFQGILYFLISLTYVHLSSDFLARTALFYLMNTIRGFRKVKLIYLPLYAAKFSLVVEAFAGSFGGIVNANPSSAWIGSSFITLFEAYSFIFSDAIVTAVLGYNLIGETSDGSLRLDAPSEIIVRFMTYTQVVFIFAVVIFLISSIAHIFLFPLSRQHALVPER